MLSVNENLPLSQVCGLSNISHSWTIVSDSKKFATNPKDYFAHKMKGMIFVVNDEQDAALCPLIKESFYQVLEAYEDELIKESDLIAARFKGKPLQNSHPSSPNSNIWFWVVGETGDHQYHEEILDILEMSLSDLHPLYVGPLDFTKQKFSGLNR